MKRTRTNFKDVKNHPVALAVEPVRKAAVEQTQVRAAERLKNAKEALQDNGWDINKVAPSPEVTDHGLVAMAKADKRNFYVGITRVKSTMGYRKHTDPLIVTWHTGGASLYTVKQVDLTNRQYDAFVVKLVGKIGECRSATLEGNHVWGFSILTVWKDQGLMGLQAKEMWKTQQIENVSKYGLPFAQWPSRLMK